jgi:hypothetical protein
MRDENSGEAAFAYRFDPAGGARLYQPNRTFHDWLSFLTKFGGSDDVFQDSQPVLETDISDFYQRIYFHRIENILHDAGADKHSFNLIKKIVQVTRSKQSFGIPVGSSVSRLLAEGLLCDTDRMLRDMDLQVTRYMDDYRIIASPRYNTHTILCRLAEHLMVTEGLSLNPSKTSVTDTAKLHSGADARLQDVFSSAEMHALREYLAASYGAEEAEPEDDVPTDNPFLEGNDLLDRLDELNAKGASDFSSRRALLKVLRRFPDFDVFRLVRDHKSLAYHLPRDFCRAIQAVCLLREDIDKAALADEVWNLLSTPPVCELAYARLWLLHLYASGSVPPHRRFVQDYPVAPSPLEERQLIFIRARLNDRPFFREHRGRLGQAGDWVKPALLIGASCLPADEYLKWIDIAVRQMQDPFARAFGDWLQERPALDEILSAH